MYYSSNPRSGNLPALPRRLKLRTASLLLPRRYPVYRVLPAVFATPRRFLPNEFCPVPAPPSPCDTLPLYPSTSISTSGQWRVRMKLTMNQNFRHPYRRSILTQDWNIRQKQFFSMQVCPNGLSAFFFAATPAWTKECSS